MNLKTEHFRIFILLNIISLFIKLLKEVLDIDFELTNTNTKIILMISINIAIFILSKTKKISTKNNLIISLIVIFLGYFIISNESNRLGGIARYYCIYSNLRNLENKEK